MERHKSDFPADLHEYFLDVQETVVTWTEREEQERHIREKLGMNPREYFIGHGHTDMHARHSYITAHIFFEDLRKI